MTIMPTSAYHTGVLLLLSLFWPTLAQAWWNEDWSYRQKITLAPSGPVEVRELPLVVRLHSGNFPFTDCKQDGADLRFVDADDKTVLPHRIERFDALYGIALVWLRVPVAGGKTPRELWLYYGNEAAPAAEGEVFGAEHALALHFPTDGNAAADAGPHALAVRGACAAVDSAGVIDAACALDGTTALRVPASAATRVDGAGMSTGAGMSLGLWVRLKSSVNDAVLFEQRDGARAITVGVDRGGVYARVTDAAGAARETVHQPIDPGRWRHVGVSVGERLSLFVDGRELASLPVAFAPMGGDIALGMDAQGKRPFIGALDEVQLLRGARPAAWMRLMHEAQSADAKLLAFAEAEGGDSGGAYLDIVRILAASVSPEGWAIIALIGLLGLVSLEAGLRKAGYLGRMQRANRAFSRQLDQSSAGIAPDMHPDAALQRLYDRALRELARLLDEHEQAGLARRLSPQGVEALRASLDVALVEEAQEMNRKMVLLTLAVSGGPFLGLLGTVVGIMITFAAIASAGDVNVNTIAPGVAAALTTTVAGLIIAIPAMFGYNHLTGQIRDLTAAMEVFVDGQVGRIAMSQALHGAGDAQA
jgi:biopolymer transport protein ExbB